MLHHERKTWTNLDFKCIKIETGLIWIIFHSNCLRFRNFFFPEWEMILYHIIQIICFQSLFSLVELCYLDFNLFLFSKHIYFLYHFIDMFWMKKSIEKWLFCTNQSISFSVYIHHKNLHILDLLMSGTTFGYLLP